MVFDEKFFLETEAKSRLSVWIINHENSPKISQIGDFTRNNFHDGFTLGDRRTNITGDARYVEGLNDVEQGSFNPAMLQIPSNQAPSIPQAIPGAQSSYLLTPIPTQRTLVPYSASAMVPQGQGNDLLSQVPQIEPLSPYSIPDLLLKSNPYYNFIRTCRMLGLDKKDFDKPKGVFTREFDADKDILIPGCNPLVTCDKFGLFDSMFVMSGGKVFELKSFKFSNRSGIYQFRFIPSHPGFWLRGGKLAPGEVAVLDPNICDVWNNTSPANIGLINAGDLTRLPWEILLWRMVQYVWRPDTIQSKDEFAAALRFLAKAKKNMVSATILKFTASGKEEMFLPAIRQQALIFDLKFPEELKEDEYIHIPFPYAEVPANIPFLWPNGYCTLFYGPGQKALLGKLIQAFQHVPSDSQNADKDTQAPEEPVVKSSFPQKNVAVLFPSGTKCRTDNLMRKLNVCTTCISAEILKKANALEMDLLRNDTGVLFIIFANEIPPSDLVNVLEVCGSARIMTGIFSEKVDGWLDGSVFDFLSQRYGVEVRGNSVNITDTETQKEERFIFEDDGFVSVAEMNRKTAKAKEN